MSRGYEIFCIVPRGCRGWVSVNNENQLRDNQQNSKWWPSGVEVYTLLSAFSGQFLYHFCISGPIRRTVR